jgi:hypothetical protein
VRVDAAGGSRERILRGWGTSGGESWERVREDSTTAFVTARIVERSSVWKQGVGKEGEMLSGQRRSLFDSHDLESGSGSIMALI